MDAVLTCSDKWACDLFNLFCIYVQEIWSREVSNGQALAFVNKNDTHREADFTFHDMKLPKATLIAVVRS